MPLILTYAADVVAMNVVSGIMVYSGLPALSPESILILALTCLYISRERMKE